MQNLENVQESSNRYSVRVFHVMWICLCVATFICEAQMSGNKAIILLCLLIYLAVTVWASHCSYAFPILLFFLPWSPLLKIVPGTVSFFTIALLMCAVVSLVKSWNSIRRYQVTLTLLIILTTLIGKIVHGNSIGLDYLVFSAMLFLFPCIVREQAKKISFYETTIFFACGIASAALAASQLANEANISQYIITQSYLMIKRSSGFYGDPNYYAAQISACLTGVQLLLYLNKNRKRQIVLIAIFALLLYCGLMSASKSFMIVLVCLFLCWISILLKKHRFKLIIALLCAGVAILSTSTFQSLLKIMLNRFGEGQGMSGLTTGRIDIWKSYLQAFFKSPSILIFGEGYTAINLYNDKGSHNTLIQLVYQFGLLGVLFVVMWMVSFIRDFAYCLNVKKVRLSHLVLICVGILLPWMAIDIVLFDEFFIMPVYAIIGFAFADAVCRDDSLVET